MNHRALNPASDRRLFLVKTLAVCSVMLLLVCFDRDLWRLAKASPDRMPELLRSDWYQSLRQLGFLPVWLAVGAALALHDLARRAPRWWDRGGTLFLAALLSGIGAEILLGTVMRQRPGPDGLYWFSWLNEGLARGPGHGFPSSHAAVAFGAAFTLARLFRASGWILIPAALGCGITRMLAGAHFASDVFGAAVLAWLVCAWVWRLRCRWEFLSGADTLG